MYMLIFLIQSLLSGLSLYYFFVVRVATVAILFWFLNTLWFGVSLILIFMSKVLLTSRYPSWMGFIFMLVFLVVLYLISLAPLVVFFLITLGFQL